MALCASNRGLSVAAFDDYDKAGMWLKATLPRDPKVGDEPFDTGTQADQGDGAPRCAHNVTGH